MNKIQGGVTAAKGFKAGGINIGIKSRDKNDLAVIYSERSCVTAGTFTLNKVFAAPVKWDRNILCNSAFSQAVVINSGIANACTGSEGDLACQMEAKAAAKALSVSSDSVLVASTGVIGMQLPIDKIVQGIEALAPKLSGTLEAGTEATRAIMTTDTKEKQVAVTVEIDGKKVTVGGMCKGAGMIHPHMATLLCFITSDAAIEQSALRKMTSEIVEDSFNMISVDGDTSTNDTVLVMANGMADNAPITIGSKNYDIYYEALCYVLTELSKLIAGDGEGCTCLFEVQVLNAAKKEQARQLAKSIVTSNLTKCAIFGHDANWGRILCAMGYSGADFEPEKVDIFFKSAVGSIKIVENGLAADYSEVKATSILSENPVTAIVDLKLGSEKATAWGCDLTFDYIKINADYRS